MEGFHAVGVAIDMVTSLTCSSGPSPPGGRLLNPALALAHPEHVIRALDRSLLNDLAPM